MRREAAIVRAGEIARDLGWPWHPKRVSARSWRLWPFARVWRVESRGDATTAWMLLNDRTSCMTRGRVIYHARDA